MTDAHTAAPIMITDQIAGLVFYLPITHMLGDYYPVAVDRDAFPLGGDPLTALSVPLIGQFGLPVFTSSALRVIFIAWSTGRKDRRIRLRLAWRARRLDTCVDQFA
ncbi:hypothetical protein A5733_18370 [Mycobacterium sp. NS-7484]|uniref:hypothetical protein n=1 Tax=Mycobacterium sp. NS-7484 TaxID=1834161 RepID=UPI00096F02A2|nr:hypothetical protein [Mycobacterium sp. NS-7484]OMC06026.1 hypothetical protein A5733_18370 [Mycobacterium sp. NS-7484]